jgi:hypothetical protein
MPYYFIMGYSSQIIGKVRRNGVYFVIGNSGYLALNDLMIVNNELERTWKENNHGLI